MTKKSLCLFLLISLTAMSIYAPATVSAAETVAYKTFVQTSFDCLTEWSGAGTGGSAITYANPEGIGTLTVDGWSANTTLNSVNAPVPANEANKKMEGTYFPSAGVDQALEAKYVTGDTGNYYFYNNFTMDEDGILKISVNFYVSSSKSTSHNMLNCELRNINNPSESNMLFSVRQQQAPSNAAIQVNTSSDTINASGYSLNKWNNATVLINTENNTFTFYFNGSIPAGLENVNMVKASTATFTGEGATKLNQLRISTTKHAVDTSCIYIDDIFFGRETTGYNPTFVKTTNIADSDNYNINNIKKDVKSITVSFPEGMNEKSLDKYVTLTRGEANIPVDFTGNYNSDSFEYTATLEEEAVPNTSYSLNFNQGVSTASNVMLNIPVSVDFETKPEFFAVTDAFFSRTSDPETRVLNIPGELEYSGDNSKVYANANIEYTKQMTENQDITVIAALYTKGGGIRKISSKADSVAVTTDDGIRTKTIQTPLDLADVDVSEIEKAVVFVWDGTDTLKPLAVNRAANVVTDLSGYTILYKNNFENHADGATAGFGSGNMSEGVASFGVADAPGSNQGKAMKMYHASDKSSGMPWIGFTLNKSQSAADSSTFVIDYKLYSVNGTAPFEYSYVVGSSPINFISYRPNKDFQNNKNANVGTYATGQWEKYRMVIKMTPEGNTYDIYQDGILVEQANNSIGASTDSTANIRIVFAKSRNTENPSIAYIDDIIVYEGTTFLSSNAIN